MKIRSGTIGKGTLPVLAAAFLCTGTQAQIITGGYTCSASFFRTNNLSLDIALTNGTCTLPVERAQWFDLSVDEDFAAQHVTLKCVDFSMWGTTNVADQLISIRVFQDLTPSSSDDGCDSQVGGYDGANEPGPDLATALLLGEDEAFIPIGVDPPVGPRLDGDFSVEFTGEQGGGILLSPDIAFFVVIAHAGEAITQFGANASGEKGDSTDGAPGGTTGGPEQTWVRPFNCTIGGGACSQTGDWQKALLYYPGNSDTVMVIHLDIGDTRDPPQLAFDCRQDIAPFDVDTETGDITIIGDQEVNVSDLLALLGSWGQTAPPRPLGDIAPCPTPGVDCPGDNQVNVSDLLSLLAAWGSCPNLVKDCSTAIDPGNITAQISEGTFPWSIEVGLLEATVERSSTNSLSAVLAGGVGICGWADYFESGGPINGTGTVSGAIWGDAFGIFMGNFNDGPGAIPPDDLPDPIVVGGDVWFQYTADCNGRAFISATSDCGGGEVVDTILEVYSGDTCPTDWTDVLLCDDSSLDPAGCGDFGEIDFNVLQGDKFLIRIAGWLGETGSGDLNISCVDNSVCSAALTIFVNAPAPETANTLNAGLSSPPNCPFTQDTGGRWFVVIGDGNRLTASTCQTEAVEIAGGQLNLFDSVLSVYCGTPGEVCSDLTCVASSNADTCNLHQEVEWCTTFGQEYYILVHGNDGVSGPPFFSEGFFILDVTTDAASCATALACGVPRPFNDKCADAFLLVPGPLVETPPDSGIFVSTVNTPTIPDTPPRHNNINALTDGPNPAPGCTFITQDVWYRYTPNFTSSVVVDTCFFLGSPVNVDTAIEIYLTADAECPPVDATGFIECQNNGDGTPLGRSCPGGSQYTTPLIIFAGQEILIRVGANGGDKEGFFTLRVEATALDSLCAVPPELDDFCPEDGVLEGGGGGEALIDDDGADTTNGGCNMCAPGQLFDTIIPAIAIFPSADAQPDPVVLCGQISTYVADADLDCVGGLDGFAYALRDTDWYTLTIPILDDEFDISSAGATVTITFASEFAASFGITEAVCGATPGDVVPFVASGLNGGLCTESTLVATLAAGDYFVVVTAFNLSGIAVGGTHEGHDYHLEIAPLGPGAVVPTVNDECETAITILATSTTVADNRAAGENPSDPLSCSDGGYGTTGGRGLASFGTIWYVFEATHDTTFIQTCNIVEGLDGGGGADSNIVVWAAGPTIPCDLGTDVGCGEDECAPFLSAVSLSGLLVGQDYYIMMGAWWITDQDVYNLELFSPAP